MSPDPVRDHALGCRISCNPDRQRYCASRRRSLSRTVLWRVGARPAWRTRTRPPGTADVSKPSDWESGSRQGFRAQSSLRRTSCCSRLSTGPCAIARLSETARPREPGALRIGCAGAAPAGQTSTARARSSVVNGSLRGAKEQRSFKPQAAGSIPAGRIPSRLAAAQVRLCSSAQGPALFARVWKAPCPSSSPGAASPCRSTPFGSACHPIGLS